MIATKKYFIPSLSLLCLLLFTTISSAAVPPMVSYQGYLTDNVGNPQNATIPITFSLFAAETGGTEALWTETHNSVSVTDGVFNVLLGSVTPISLDFNQDYWLETTVNGEVLSPRQPIVSAGYAFRAEYANKAGNPAPPCTDDINRYVDCGNGTVTDTVTGLIWLKDADCFHGVTYAEAVNAATGLKDGDCDLSDNSSPGDWRLPTKNEWAATIIQADNLSCTNPNLTDTAGTGCYAASAAPQFIGVQLSYYWSTNAADNIPGFAWRLNMSGGSWNSNSKTLSSYVWPVRR